jgi:hypothetical protein
VIWSLWAEGVEIQHRLSAAFCCSEVYMGTRMFAGGQTIVTDQQSGHLSTLMIEQNIEQIQALILDNRSCDGKLTAD